MRKRPWVPALSTLVAACALLTCARSPDRKTEHAAAASQPKKDAPPSPNVAAAARPPEPWPGPRGEYFFREAEAFQLLGDAWHVMSTRGGARSRGWASGGQALDGRGAEAGSAVTTFHVTQAGRYVLWLRLQGLRAAGTASSTEGARVSVAVRQGARTLLDAPVEAETNLPKLSPTDFAWRRLEVELPRGETTVSLTKVPEGHTGFRVVDCLLITTDSAYLPDPRDFHEQIYARARAAADAPAALSVRNALTTARLRRGALFEQVAPGRASAWQNITRWSEGAGDMLLPLTAESASGKGTCYLDFASVPDGKQVTKSVALEATSGLTHVVVPASLRARPPESSLELAKARADLVKQLSAVPFGKRPLQFPMLIDLRSDAGSDVWEKDVAEYVGINGFTSALSASDIARGFVFTRVYNSAFYLGKSGYLDVDWSKMRADLEADGKAQRDDPNWSRVQHLKLIDEAQAPALATLAADPLAQSGFERWLERRRRQEGQPAIPHPRLPAERDAGDPRLYYYAQRYRASLVVDFFRRASELARQSYPAGVRTTQNLSDGAVVFANMYAQGNDYFEYFKSGALDVALSEDWTNAGATRQLCGWNVALLRAATKYKHQPIQMYVIAYSSRKPLEVKLKAYSDIAQGAKLLDLYSYTPQYLGGEVGWAENLPVIEAAAELTHEIGAAEHVLLDAAPVKAQVALVYSVAADIWGAGYDITHGNERMATYLLLRHAQVSSDVVSDDDVQQGGLQGYRVAYVNDDVLPRQAARRLEAWVRAGGTLVLGASAASKDEWGRQTSALTNALGLEPTNERNAGLSTLPTGSLDKLPPDVAELRIGESPTFGAPLLANAFIERPGTEVLARFSDGSAAAVRRKVGKGEVLALGFLPATAYLRSALVAARATADTLTTPPPLLSRAFQLTRAAAKVGGPTLVPSSEIWGTLLTAYPSALRSLVAGPALAAGLQRVYADEPLVESTLLEGKVGFVVPLANYSGRLLPNVTLQVAPSAKVSRLFSARLGELRVEAGTDGRLSVQLPLESTDFVFADWVDQRP